MKVRKSARLVAALSAVALTPITLACWRVAFDTSFTDGIENFPTPCAFAGCNSWLICPRNDTCTSGFVSGFDSCGVPTLTSIPCLQYSGGTPNALGCCTGGTLIGPSATKFNVWRYNTVGAPCTEPF
jgi:hypothetical protein